MLHSRHIVVLDFPDGKTETVYNGPSSAEAKDAFDKAIAKCEADTVLLFSHPMPSLIRHPQQEAAAAKERKEFSEVRANAEEQKKAADIAKHKAEIKRLQGEIKKLS
jgi:hypothetical protein